MTKAPFIPRASSCGYLSALSDVGSVLHMAVLNRSGRWENEHILCQRASGLGASRPCSFYHQQEMIIHSMILLRLIRMAVESQTLIWVFWLTLNDISHTGQWHPINARHFWPSFPFLLSNFSHITAIGPDRQWISWVVIAFLWWLRTSPCGIQHTRHVADSSLQPFGTWVFHFQYKKGKILCWFNDSGFKHRSEK